MGASEGSADLSHAASRRAAHPASRGVAGVGPAGRDAALLLVGRELAQRRRGGQPIRVWFSWPIAISLRKPTFLTIAFSWMSLDSLVRIETCQRVTRAEAASYCHEACGWALAPAEQRPHAQEQ